MTARSLWIAGLLAVPTLACGDVVSQPIAGSGPGGDASLPLDGAAPDASRPPSPDAFAPSADAGTDAFAPSADAASSLESGPSNGDAGSSFCSGHGPIPLPGRNACVGDLADVFRFAACACKSLDVSGTFSTDSFDSTSDGGPASGNLASIGSNGEISTNSRTSIAGSLWTGGPGPDGGPAVTLKGGTSGGGTIADDVHSAANMEVGGKYLIEGDLFANGNVSVDPGGNLAVLGTVTIPPGASASGVQGTVVNAPVSVTAPCSCSSPIEVGAIVSAYANSNDDVAAGISPTAPLTGEVTLPCGRYYAAGLSGDSVDLRIDGRVALFLEGDLSVTQDLRVELAPSAELDMFVTGSASIMGSFEIGDADSPARTRLYIGGSTLALAADVNPMAANVYAPNAVLEISSNFEMWGAIFAQRLQFSGDFSIHYDTSVLQVAEASGCAATGGACQSCNDCSGATPACKAGTCAPCTSSADCCAPLTCDGNGRCGLTIH